MSLRIRLARGGAKKRPFYRIVVADSRSPRDGRFIEKIGTYNPMVAKDHPDRIKLDEDRAKHWLSVGATPSDRVARFLGQANIIAVPAIPEQTKKNQPRAKTLERMKAAEEAKAAAAQAAAAEAAAEAAPAEGPGGRGPGGRGRRGRNPWEGSSGRRVCSRRVCSRGVCGRGICGRGDARRTAGSRRGGFRRGREEGVSRRSARALSRRPGPWAKSGSVWARW